MKKLSALLVAVLFGATTYSAQALDSIFDGFVVLDVNGGGSQFYDLDLNTGNADFHGATFTINAGESILLGGQVETSPSGFGGNTAGAESARLNYELGLGSGFVALNLPFNSNQDGNTVDRWERSGASMVQIGSSLAPGSYKLSVYLDATDDTEPKTVYLNRDGQPLSNWEATINVIPEPTSFALVGLTLLGALRLRRRTV